MKSKPMILVALVLAMPFTLYAAQHVPFDKNRKVYYWHNNSDYVLFYKSADAIFIEKPAYMEGDKLKQFTEKKLSEVLPTIKTARNKVTVNLEKKENVIWTTEQLERIKGFLEQLGFTDVGFDLGIDFDEGQLRPADPVIIQKHQRDLADKTLDVLIASLSSNEKEKSIAAQLLILKLGRDSLPHLVNEMNRDTYFSDRTDLSKLGDPRWISRLRLASLIEDISGEDFDCRTTVHGWEPDHSFNKINEWWRERQRRNPMQDSLNSEAIEICRGECR